MMKRYDMIVVGAGPAGLSAAIEAAKKGMHVVVYDENAKPGGQLFKQIHKFFGSKEHKAKIRGFHIGEELLAEAASLGVEVVLNAIVIGIFPEKEVTVKVEDHVIHVKGDTILIATGASENMVTFPGWTLPGVIGAGAAHDEPPRHTAGQACADAGFRQRRSGGQLSADAGRLRSGCRGRCSAPCRRLRRPCRKGRKMRRAVLSVAHHHFR